MFKMKKRNLVSENVDFNDDGKIKSVDVLAPKRLNMGVMIIVLVMMAFGLVMLFSASMPLASTYKQNSTFYVINQGKYLILGFAMSLIIAFLPIKKFDKLPFFLLAFGMAIGLALVTKFKGSVINGARRWLIIGGVSFQPSEFIKVALVFFIAGYRSFIQRRRKKGKLIAPKWISQTNFDAILDITLPGGMVLGCLAIIALQPHMSCFLILCAVCAVCFFCSGISFRSWVRGGVLLLVIGIIVGCSYYLLSGVEGRQKLAKNFEHVFTRLNIFASMQEEDEATEEDAEVAKADADEQYQNRQSLIAIGSGGLRGVGFGNSRQKYNYLPEAHNDYVYSIICEELGFVGGVCVMVLFWLFMLAGFLVSWQADSLFTRILTAGYTTLITIQAFLNIGVAINAIPPTGITLPFFSYGGTANCFFMIAVGMILSVSRSGRKRKTLKLVV